MSKYWLGALLYLEYIEFEADSGVLSDFRPTARYGVSPDIIEQTLDDILNNKINPQKNIGYLPGQVDPVQRPRTGHSAPPISDPERPFTKWLELQKEFYLDRGK